VVWVVLYDVVTVAALSLAHAPCVVSPSPLVCWNWPCARQVSLPTSCSGTQNLTFSITVSNTGAVPGDEVVFGFFAPSGLTAQPQNRLLKYAEHCDTSVTLLYTFTIRMAHHSPHGA
jgi:uncharacterized repeat protein (TIGR01451 family)